MFNSKVNEGKICTVLFTIIFFRSIIVYIYIYIYSTFPFFCRWVLILFQSLEYVPRKNQNIVLFGKI